MHIQLYTLIKQLASYTAHWSKRCHYETLKVTKVLLLTGGILGLQFWYRYSPAHLV